MATTEPSGGAMSLLEEIRDLERRLARVRRSLVELGDAGAGSDLQALEVRCAGRLLLVPVASVREVLPVPMPTPLADAPGWVMGTFSYAGVTVPMVDLGQRVGGGPTPLAPDLRVVVCDWPSWIALVVEDVGAVVDLDPSRLDPPPPELRAAAFVVAIGASGEGRQATVISPARVACELDA